MVGSSRDYAATVSPKPRLTSAGIWPEVNIYLKLSNYALTSDFTSLNSYVILRPQHKNNDPSVKGKRSFPTTQLYINLIVRHQCWGFRTLDNCFDLRVVSQKVEKMIMTGSLRILVILSKLDSSNR